MQEMVMSTLSKTWIMDLDGTLVKHNGYKIDGEDTLLSGAKEFLEGLPEDDRVIILTSRSEEYRDQTISFLRRNRLRYDEIVFNMPMGERIVVNDRKPSGIDMAMAINIKRDSFFIPSIKRIL